MSFEHDHLYSDATMTEIELLNQTLSEIISIFITFALQTSESHSDICEKSSASKGSTTITDHADHYNEFRLFDFLRRITWTVDDLCSINSTIPYQATKFSSFITSTLRAFNSKLVIYYYSSLSHNSLWNIVIRGPASKFYLVCIIKRKNDPT